MGVRYTDSSVWDRRFMQDGDRDWVKRTGSGDGAARETHGVRHAVLGYIPEQVDHGPQETV